MDEKLTRGTRWLVIVGVVFSGIFIQAFVTPAAVAAEFLIRYSGIQGPGDPNTKSQFFFKEELERLSGGRIQVQVYYGQQLAGGNTMDQLRMVKLGAIEMTGTGQSQLSQDLPNFGALALPFLFSSLQEANAALDGRAFPILAKDTEKIGLKLIGFQNMGLRNVVTKKAPVKRLSDLKGLRLRVVQGAVGIATYQALGANPVPLDFAELPAAMTQGVLDGFDMPLTPSVNLKVYGYGKYYTLTQTYLETQVVVINTAFFNKLPRDLQQMLLKAAKDANDFQRKQHAKDEADAMAVLKANGMQIIELPPEELERARTLVKGVYAKFEPQFSPELLAALRSRP